ncbi:hypothetical protein PQQ59_06160 [Paraburkholderia aspalathi]|uniref:hypothetical protein n=1 Tax=Paraburkholderia aspalathi TaxID=1324617 RepID=UPI0038B8D11A
MITNTDAAARREAFERCLLAVEEAITLRGARESIKVLIDAVAAPSSEVQADHIADERKMEWLPIETAPKTGRTVLLGYPNSAGKWRTVRGQWMSEAYIADYWEEPDDVEPGWFETSEEADDVPNCWRIEPTHWMPLPAAPASSAGDQEVES